MKITLDLHTHTTYSHGKGSILENAISAKEKGVEGIAITDHGFSHPAFGMRRRKLDKMRIECDNAEKQTGVKVLLGIESNIRGKDGTIDVKPTDYAKLDVVLAGVHKFIMYKSLGDVNKLLLKNMWHDKFKTKASDKLIKYNTEWAQGVFSSFSKLEDGIDIATEFETVQQFFTTAFTPAQ